MKLQNMTVIFIIIMIPIIIVTSYYIGLQIKTITMQKDYTVKLQTAAKDSIQALEINTVEWNSASSNLADSKRRDVLASINTFTTSLANNMGIGGAGKGRIQTYIPAIVYTMYDGYYIYSASLMKDQKTDKDGLTQFEKDTSGKDTGNIKYNTEGTSSYQYILKPYSPYSARYVNGNVDVTVNYTLDNYIRVYGKVGTGDEDKSVAKEGYLVVCDSDEGVKGVTSGRISGIEYRGAVIKPETLKENVYNVYIDKEEIKEYPYIYDQYDNKLYWDGNNYFSVDKYNNKVYLQNALPEGDAGFSITNRFRKISIPVENRQGELTVQKVFQILNPGGGFKFYYENESGAFVEFTSVENIDGSDNKKLAGVEVEKDKDFSAINYCVESYVFTKWVTKNLGNITVGDMQISTGNSINSLKNITSAEQQYYGQYNNVDDRANIFEINDINNNPDPENDDAYAKSVLAQHKKDIIINTIEKNLSQATAQAQAMNLNYEYRLPQLSYDEWEQALSNISIIAFMQGMPIGLKYYNNYAIATSTLNKEFVDPDELYFAGTDDQYYHQRQCEQATGSDYVGYRSIDYVAKSYEVESDTTKSTKYYYPHANERISTDSELECYYCLVNRSTYKNNGRWKGNLLYKNWSDSYYNALARERYMQLDEPGTYKPNVTVKKEASDSSVEYGGTVTYTIKIKNNGIVEDTVNLLDFWDEEDFDSKTINITLNELGVVLNQNTVIYEKDEEGKNKIDQNGKPIAKNGIFAEKIKIGAKQEKTLEYTIKVKGKLGEPLVNTAAVYSWGNNDVSIDEATATTSVEKKVTIASVTNINNYNIIMILDQSSSMRPVGGTNRMKPMYLAVEDLVAKGGALYNLYENPNIQVTLSIIKFHANVEIANDEKFPLENRVYFEEIKKKEDLKTVEDYYGKKAGIVGAGTNYNGALTKAKSMCKTDTNNIIIFLTDGSPTGDVDTIEYRIIQIKDGETYKEAYQWRSWPTKGEWAWANDISNIGKNIWNNIKTTVNDEETGLKKHAEIYCINYGADGAEYGLLNIISSGEGYYSTADTSNIKTKFNNIINNIKPLETNTDPIYSQNGILTIEKPDKLKYIKVNGTSIEPKDLEKPIKDGKLDLTQFDIGATIELVY